MQYNPRGAKYLLRFDDICPTMNWKVWSDIEGALRERNLKPILAVVPDNKDPVLEVDPPMKDFWERVRGWQDRGWTIALHGYQHRYVTYHPGVVTTKKKSEFAGVQALDQEEKLRRGVAIFESHGIKTHLWIAPSNSFDLSTVALLPKFGISMICDGLFRFPFVCPRNVFWIPQQLFRFQPAPAGVWTVCYHHNYWTDAQLRKFRDDLENYGPMISCLEEIVQEWAGRHSWWSSFICNSPRLAPLLIRSELKLTSWWKALPVREQSSLKDLSTLQPR